MAGVFINYRSKGSSAYAALLHLALVRHFGPESVFLDSESIAAGAAVAETLLGRVRSCRVLLAVIGPGWLATDGAGRRRIDDPEDWIRRELAEAFAAKVVVIPVLVGGATMPVEGDLPADIAALGRCRYRMLRHRDASADLARILADVAAADPALAVVARRLSAAGRGVAPADVAATREGVAEALFGGPAAAGRAALAGWSAPAGWSALAGWSAPAGWLDPAAGVVRARKRPEVAGLVRWCRAKRAPVLRLVCGPGGQGKTQLAAQVCQALTARRSGWLAGFVRPPAVLWRDGSAADVGTGELPDALGQRAATVAALRALPASDVPGVLLVVDYAGGGPEFVSALLREAVALSWPRSAGRAVPVRVLLLARDEPDWWRNLTDLAEPGWVEPQPLALEPLPEALAAGRRGVAEATRDLWTDAVRAFSARAVRDRLLAEPPPRGRLTASPPTGFATTLDLYADALLRVLDHAAGTPGGGTPGDGTPGGEPVGRGESAAVAGTPGTSSADPVLGILGHERRALARSLDGAADHAGGGTPDGEPVGRGESAGVAGAGNADPIVGILGHERRLLARSLDGVAAGTSGRQRDLAVSVAFLCPAAGMAAAVRALAAAPALSGLPEDVLGDLTRSLAALYQPAGGPGPGAAVWQAPRPDRLADTHLLRTAAECRSDAEWSAHVVAVCGTGEPLVAGHAARVLVRCLSTPGAPAVGLDRVHQSLIALLRARPAEYLPLLASLAPARFATEVVAALHRRDPGTGRHAVGTEVVERVDRELRATGFTTSRTAIAVAVSRRLVEQRRSGDDTGPAAIRFAERLVVFSRRLAEDGQAAEAVPPAREAVDRYRAVSRAAPGSHRIGLASALTNHSNRLADQGQAAPALQAAEDAAALRLELADGGTGHDRSDAAAALHTLALRRAEDNQPEAALDPARWAVQMLTALADANPAYRPRLATAQTTAAQLAAAVGDLREAASQARQAVQALRQLAAANPDSHRRGLAAALMCLSSCLAPPAGRTRTSVAARQAVRLAVRLAAEAAAICRDLATANPATHEPDLAAVLANLGLRHAVTGRQADAVAATGEALTLRRRLAKHDPRRHVPDLAATLTKIALLLGPRHRTALDHARESVDTYRTLAADHPAARRDLPAALANLGFLLAQAGQHDAAVTASTEAADRYGRLYAELPDLGHRVHQADAQHNLGLHLLHTGSAKAAAAMLGDAINGYCLLAEVAPRAARARLRASRAAWELAEAATAATPDAPPRDPGRAARRYTRQWHEEAIRYALPGATPLAA